MPPVPQLVQQANNLGNNVAVNTRGPVNQNIGQFGNNAGVGVGQAAGK